MIEARGVADLAAGLSALLRLAVHAPRGRRALTFDDCVRFVDGRCRGGGGVTRREWLRLGGLAGLGFGAATARGAERRAARAGTSGFGRARSVVVVYANGGQSQLEMWDPKPDAPVEVRGEFAAISSTVPGTFLGEHLPRLARLADRYTIVRSVAHDDLDHGSATYQALTGRAHRIKSSNPPPSPADFPTYGAVLKRVRPTDRFPETAVHVNGPALVPEQPGPGQDGGFLGREFTPLVLGDSREKPIPFELTAGVEVPTVRREARRSLLDSIEGTCRRWQDDPAMLEMSRRYRQAYTFLASPRYREAFDLTQEPDALRDRYGRNRSGQACLLARRLVEVGVPLITVMWNHSARGQDKSPDDPESFGWDTHNDIFETLRAHLLPRFDQSFSALLEDLEARGLLDETLVVCMGEFGRAPRVALEAKFAGQTPGRKHWASAYSIVVAGAGVTRGATLGGTDRLAAYPVADRVGPWDIAATMFAALGVDPATEYVDPLGRPFPLSIGTPIAGLYRG
jgi:hypothetical protein